MDDAAFERSEPPPGGSQITLVTTYDSHRDRLLS
jgi:hypothetical protein